MRSCLDRLPRREWLALGRTLPGGATSDLLLGADLAGVLAVGDLQYESAQTRAFALSFGPSWGRLGRLIHPVLGNHEYVPPQPTVAYFDYFNGLRHTGGVAGPRPTGWYSFDLGNWHLIALNSNCRYVGGCGKESPEVRWLKADLAAHPVRCTLAYWHHPRWSSGSHGDQGQMSRIWKTLVAAKADVVISGHDHDYERFAPQGRRRQAKRFGGDPGVRRRDGRQEPRSLHPPPGRREQRGA